MHFLTWKKRLFNRGEGCTPQIQCNLCLKCVLGGSRYFKGKLILLLPFFSRSAYLPTSHFASQPKLGFVQESVLGQRVMQVMCTSRVDIVHLTGQEWILCRCYAGGEWVAGNGWLHEVFMGCKERGRLHLHTLQGWLHLHLTGCNPPFPSPTSLTAPQFSLPPLLPPFHPQALQLFENYLVLSCLPTE